MKHRKSRTTKDRPACIGRGEPAQTGEDVEHLRLCAERTRSQSRPFKKKLVARDHSVKIAADHDGVPRRTAEVEFEAEKDSELGVRQAALGEAPDKCSSRSDQDRMRDALEDDEVREVLRMNRRGSPSN